ncbi:MAG: hypothetical protein JWO92_2540 [Chitinophagaceae bacterium]|nr:hypothetical protein [Chitinophagaceae bacterium]
MIKNKLIEKSLIISFQIVAVYILFRQGMLLGWLRVAIANRLDKICGLKLSKQIQAPLFECLICMSSVWTIILTFSFDIRLMLLVCGMNTIISIILDQEYHTSK